MLRFEPPELQKDLASAIRALEDVVYIYNFYQVHEEDFDPSAHGDDVITRDTPIEHCRLASTDEYSQTIKVGDLIDWASILQRYKLKKRTYLRMETKTLFYVHGEGADAYSLACAIRDGKTNVFQTIKIEGESYAASVICGFTPFALFIEKEGENDSTYCASFYDITTYLEVNHPESALPETVEALANALLFELGSGGGPYLSINPYPSMMDIDIYDHDDAGSCPKIKMRPLKTGLGLKDLHELFLAGCSANPAEYALIHFVKVIEYVSATVVRMSRHDALRRRLSTKTALSPDATFLDGLAALLEEQRIFNKDSEAIKLTIQTCCDPVVLAEEAPTFLKQLRGLRFSDDPKLRKVAVEEFSACLSATRNQLSHAKANYALTGTECPSDGLVELTACAKTAAEQAIRWYAALPEHARVV
jgi:hypothetical protein